MATGGADSRPHSIPEPVAQWREGGLRAPTCRCLSSAAAESTSPLSCLLTSARLEGLWFGRRQRDTLPGLGHVDLAWKRLRFSCRISEPSASVGRHIETRLTACLCPSLCRSTRINGYCGADLPFQRRVRWECVLGSLVGGSVHRGLTGSCMALVAGVGLALLAGSAQPADAAASIR